MKNYLRPISRFLILMGGVCLFSACGEKDAASESDRAASSRSDGPETITILTWEEYFAPEVIAAFEEESGIGVAFDYYQNLGEMNGKILSNPGRYDVIVIDDVTLAEMIEVKQLREIERERLPGLANFSSRYLDQEFDPGNRFSVPYLWGTSMIAYRSDLIAEPEESWNLLWKDEYAGHVALMDEKDDVFAAALLTLGQKIDTRSGEEIEEAVRFLESKVRGNRIELHSLEDIKDRLIAGQCWAALIYSGDAAVIAEEDDRIAYFIPREGAPIWMDSFAIPRESGHVEGAHAFIDFISRPEIAARNANFLWYATPNEKALPMLNEELLADAAIFPLSEVLDRCAFHPRPSEERIEVTNQGMKRVLDAASGVPVALGGNTDAVRVSNLIETGEVVGDAR
ncbi:MAG: spermidine/putrescine ABC transporter substrate-binding protein [Verrucomicrobiae bacterium]|nr:spermidine/putrescine ABC transporter substrate-binding protein [Verrucomicrobiae bacterium]